MFDLNSQDVSAENLISEARKYVFLLLLVIVSAEIAVFEKKTNDVSLNVLILFY